MRSWLMYQILKNSKVLTVEIKIRGQKENENSSFYVGSMLYKASINFTIILEPGLLPTPCASHSAVTGSTVSLPTSRSCYDNQLHTI